MRKAIYPGSFDPVTLGHINIIDRVSKFFDEVTILVAQAQNKEYLFSVEERRAFLQEALKNYKNIKIDFHGGLTVDYAKRNSIRVLIRGLRGPSDFEQEWSIAHMNKRLNPEIETLFIFSDIEHSHVSSRIVKEVAVNGGPLETLVPKEVASKLLMKLRHK